jgi:hypothetical protein
VFNLSEQPDLVKQNFFDGCSSSRRGGRIHQGPHSLSHYVQRVGDKLEIVGGVRQLENTNQYLGGDAVILDFGMKDLEPISKIGKWFEVKEGKGS